MKLSPNVAKTTAPSAAEILSYMPLVNQVVARFMGNLPPNVLRDDLLAAGTFGLIDSLRKNGPERGPAFEWYARIRIRGAIFDELRTQDWLSRRARSRVTQAAADTGTSARAVVIGFDDLPSSSQAHFADHNAPDPLALVVEGCDRLALTSAVASLPEREQKIIAMHYFQGVQFKAIALELGVSEPRVSQLHSRAVAMLRTAMTISEAA
ncbi:MAG: sigma-70 family RNA polymerase sigma factor [Polyangiaceae bacterium]